MFKKFARTKVTDLTVGKSLVYNFVVPIAQVAGYALSLGVAAGVWTRTHPKPVPEPETTESTEE